MISYKLYMSIVTIIVAILSILIQFGVLSLSEGIDQRVWELAGIVWSLLVAAGLGVDKIQSDSAAIIPTKRVFRKYN